MADIKLTGRPDDCDDDDNDCDDGRKRGKRGHRGHDGPEGPTGPTGAGGGPFGTTGPTGPTGATGPSGGGGLFSMFFGLTTGTGNGGPNDYAATVAVGAQVPFPRTGPDTGAGVRVDGSSFTLAPGTYRVTATVHTTEPGQLELQLDGVAVDNSNFGNANPTSGGHPIIVDAIITIPAGPGQVLAVVNPVGNSTALTITPSDGALTHAYSQKLIIEKLA